MVMARYFKLVCLSNPTWILDEFLKGRVRFGWSPPGTDLREIARQDRDVRSDQERTTWKQAQFLVTKVRSGDRIVVQPEQPLESFVIGELIEPGYKFDSDTKADFNHILHVRPLTPAPIPVNAKEVSAALKHDLSKRGAYFQIYPDRSLKELDDLVERAVAKNLDLTKVRGDEDTQDRNLRGVTAAIIKEISQSWPGKEFEKLCEDLCNSLDYIEVKERKDSGKGWDLLVRVINPITQSILADEVPVQCKNYTGAVTETNLIDDLVRSIGNIEIENNLALLFILGDSTEDFHAAVQARQEHVLEN
jgi:hypothetical protein